MTVIVKEYALLILSSQVSLSPSLSISLSLSLSLSLVFVGIRKDLGGVFQWQVDKICSQQKAFPKPKTHDSTVNIHIAGMFSSIFASL